MDYIYIYIYIYIMQYSYIISKIGTLQLQHAFEKAFHNNIYKNKRTNTKEI